MGQHTLNEKARNELREKVMNRLLADDVTFRDFSVIDSYEFISFNDTPSINDVTASIWEDIVTYMEEYCMTFYNRNNDVAERIVNELLSEIGDQIVEKMTTLPVPYDDRFPSEIMADEHVTFATARAYKSALNTGITCYAAMTPMVNLSEQYYFFCDYVNNPHVKRLLEKQIGKIKVRDLIK